MSKVAWQLGDTQGTMFGPVSTDLLIQCSFFNDFILIPLDYELTFSNCSYAAEYTCHTGILPNAAVYHEEG